MTHISGTDLVGSYDTRISNAEKRIQDKVAAGTLSDTQASDFETRLQSLASALLKADPASAGLGKSLHAMDGQLRTIGKEVSQDVTGSEATTKASTRQIALDGMLTKLSDRTAALVADHKLTDDQNSALQSDLTSLQQQVAGINPSQPPTGKSMAALYHAIFEEERTINQDISANRAAG